MKFSVEKISQNEEMINRTRVAESYISSNKAVEKPLSLAVEFQSKS